MLAEDVVMFGYQPVSSEMSIGELGDVEEEIDDFVRELNDDVVTSMWEMWLYDHSYVSQFKSVIFTVPSNENEERLSDNRIRYFYWGLHKWIQFYLPTLQGPRLDLRFVHLIYYPRPSLVYASRWQNPPNIIRMAEEGSEENPIVIM